MAKKVNVKGLGSNLIGVVAGGAASAVADKYVLTGSLSKYKDYAKAAVGIALPIFVKSKMVEDIADGMLAVAACNIVSGFLPGSSTTTTTTTTAATSGIPQTIGAAPFPRYAKMVKEMGAGVEGVGNTGYPRTIQ